ncbi:MAG: metallophosphoesterase [Ignavibacteria bacterium]|nr:metallophosphoesterase [Ignavibacteria bacterium]
MKKPGEPTPVKGSRWSFVHVSDMHIGTPRSFRFQPAWNENWTTARGQIVALRPDFLLVGGDMTRDGSTHRLELEIVKKDLDTLPFPTHVIPGNHEIGNKFSPDSHVAIQPDYVRLYKSVFGESEWTFSHRGVRFSGCDAFLLGSGLPEEARLREWLERQPREAREQQHVWIIHPALFADQVFEEDWNPTTHPVEWYFVLDGSHRRYLLDIFHATGVTHIITAHIHCRRQIELEGMQLHLAPSTAFPQWEERWPDGDARLGFLHFTVNTSGIECTFVPLRNISKKKGYGPGGNPPLEGRDYSIAPEQPPIDPEENRKPGS